MSFITEQNDLEKKQKIEEYRMVLQNAKSTYRDIAITQLSIANNLLLTLAIGFLTFNFDTSKKVLIDLKSSIDWNICFYILFVISGVVSIICGIAVIFSRLYDFKITRYIIKIRLRILNKYGIKLEYNNYPSPFLKEELITLFTVFFKKTKPIHNKFVNNYQIHKVEFNQEFEKFRKLSAVLGKISIHFTKLQALFLIISILAFVICFIS